MATTKQYHTTVAGHYHWKLLLNIDNSNGGEFQRHYTIEIVTRISRKTTRDETTKELMKTNMDFKHSVEGGAKIKILSAKSTSSAGYSLHLEHLNELQTHTEENYFFEKKETLSDTVTVRPGEHFRLYQLIFDGPGVFGQYKTLASNPTEIDPVEIEVVVETIEATQAPFHCFRKDEMAYYDYPGWSGFHSLSGWGWTHENIAFYAFSPDQPKPRGCDEIHLWRKGEMAYYCHLGWSGYHSMGSPWGWTHEKLAFYAYPPESTLGIPIHCFRKGEKSFLCHEGWEGYSKLRSWGWTHERIAFRVPKIGSNSRL